MKKTSRLFTILLSAMVLLTSFPIQTEAATIELNKATATVYVGSSTTLKMKGTSEETTWSTSNKKVATVSSKGKVTGKKAGTATITAKVGKKSYKCKVTVKKPYISDSKKTIYVGKSYTLKLKGTSIASVKTSNSKVATVSKKGKVTAKKVGTATITLKGKDGKSYKCQITVKNSSSKTSSNETMTYVCNTNTMKFHYESCYSVKRIKAENYDEYTGDRDDLIENGYDPCKNCNP